VVVHVEHDPETDLMGPIDEAGKVVGSAIQSRRRVEIHAVVPPAEATGKFCDRHHLDRGHAERGQRRQLARGRVPRPLRREGTDVQLVEDLAGAA
jgi:hypothetical protein